MATKKATENAAIQNTETTAIFIAAPTFSTMTIRLCGTTPLIVHAWSHKSKAMMLAAMQETVKVKKNEREIRIPMEDYLESAYRIGGQFEYNRALSEQENLDKAIEEWKNGNEFGIPAKGLKACATAGAYRAGLVKNQVICRAAFFIEGEGDDFLVPIHTPVFPRMREDTVRVGMGSTDLRYRPQFDEWYCDVPVKFNKDLIDANSLVNMFMIGGQGVGMCEDRIEKGGNYGTFIVVPNPN